MTRAAGEAAAVAAMVAATLLWGATFVIIRDTVTALPPVPLVALRFGVAGGLLALVLAARRRWPRRREWLGGTLSGLAMLGGFVLQAEGLRTTAAGTSAFLTCAGTLLAAFWAWALLGQRPGRTLLGGLALAALGAALLTLRRGLAPGGGELLTLLGAALFALQIVAVARFAPGADVPALAAVQALVVAAALAPFARGAGGALAHLAPADRLRFAYLAVAGSTIAPLLQVQAQRTLPPGRTGLLFALEPVFAALFAVTLGGERFAPRWWLGVALILAAVVWVESRVGRAAEPAPA